MAEDESIFCSEQCRETDRYRSFKACDLCGNRWSGSGGAPYYCNTAWKICKTCAAERALCVVCGQDIDGSVASDDRRFIGDDHECGS